MKSILSFLVFAIATASFGQKSPVPVPITEQDAAGILDRFTGTYRNGATLINVTPTRESNCFKVQISNMPLAGTEFCLKQLNVENGGIAISNGANNFPEFKQYVVYRREDFNPIEKSTSSSELIKIFRDSQIILFYDDGTISYYAHELFRSKDISKTNELAKYAHYKKVL